MTIHFAPVLFATVSGTPTLDLGTPLYVFETLYWDPIKKSNQPLPKHFWALYQPDNPGAIFSGTASTANGQSTFSIPAPPAPTPPPAKPPSPAPAPPAATLPAGEYSLALYPFPNDIRAAYMSRKEAWIDLATNQWVPAPTAPLTAMERRKLVRIPTWTSVRQATSYGGGFDKVPTKAEIHFRKTGLLKSAEIEPFGTAADPWQIVLDRDWIKAHVRYTFINWKDGKEEKLPPGLLVEAVDAKGRTLASGTAIDDADGTAYVLVPATRDRWKDLDFGFRAPTLTRVDLSTAAATPDTRLTNTSPLPADRNTRNTLPNAWHSKGMSAQYAASATGSPGKRKQWTTLRADIANDAAATEPLVVFQLDDLVLHDGKKLATVADKSRYTAFDHLLAIRDHDTALPHYSKGDISSPLFDQKSIYVVNASSAPAAPTVLRDLGTRLVNLGNKFYDVEEKRVVGTWGETMCLGARAAVRSDHPIAEYHSGSPYMANQGFFETHFIDVPGVKDPRSSQPLKHLLLYVACTVDLNDLPQGPLYDVLKTASERWSQGSPGVTIPTKDYRILAKDPAKRNAVIRLRAFFGVSDDWILKIKLEKGGNRSNTAPAWWIFRNPRLTYYDGSMAGDAAGSPLSNDSDGVKYDWQTLTHEFGHVLGLPDEYAEELSPDAIDKTIPTQDPRVPGYSPPKEAMPTDYRPFYSDAHAMMTSNELPRLRHVRHHVEALSTDAAFASVPDRPFVIRHETLGGGIEYVRPIDEHAHPYVAEFSGESIPRTLANCALFPVGQDEGVAEAMFAPQGTFAPTTLPPGARFDALLLVRFRVRFKFADTISKPKQWATIWSDFIKRIYDPEGRLAPGVRFGLTGGSKVPRIAILLHPQCDVGSGAFTHDDLVMSFSSSATPKANPFATTGHVGDSIDLDISQFDAFSVLRTVLGVPTAIAAPPLPPGTPAGTPPPPPILKTGPLVPAELAGVARLVESKLGEAALTRSVVPI